MNPETKKFCVFGILRDFLERTSANFARKKQLAVIKKWHSFAHHCLKLWNGYCAVYTLRSRRAFCPLCEPNLKTVSLRKFDHHRSLADVALVNLKRVPRNFKGCTTKEHQTRNVESFLRLPKNAKTTLKLLSEEAIGSIYQLCYSVPTIRKKIEQNLL